jgi:hypothetical protein
VTDSQPRRTGQYDRGELKGRMRRDEGIERRRQAAAGEITGDGAAKGAVEREEEDRAESKE